MNLVKGINSFSGEIIPQIETEFSVVLPSPINNLTNPSKHFPKCGSTSFNFEDFDKSSISSSFDKK